MESGVAGLVTGAVAAAVVKSRGQGVEEMLARTPEDLALWTLYRQVRGSYQQVCRVLVTRGLLAEMPADLDKPIKV